MKNSIILLLFGVIMFSGLGFAIGRMAAASGYKTGYEAGRQDALTRMHMDSIINYTSCMGEPPACEKERYTWQWVGQHVD